MEKRDLTQGDRNFYKENGYLHIPKFFDEEYCKKLMDEAERVAAGDYRFYLTMHKESELFLETLRHPAILRVLDQLQSARMIPIGSVYFFCKPGNKREQGSVWHQDNYAAKAPEGSYFVCAIALDDADIDNGSLIVFPGTHKLGNLPSQPKKNIERLESGEVKVYPVGNPTEVPEGYEQKQLTYKRGDLLLIHGLLLHGAFPNLSKDRWRRKLYMHYIKDGDPFWPGWNARRSLIDRGDFNDATPLGSDLTKESAIV